MVTKTDDLCVGCIAKFTDDVSCVFGRTLYDHDTSYGQVVCTPDVEELCVVVRDLDERDAFWHGTRQRCNNSYAPTRVRRGLLRESVQDVFRQQKKFDEGRVNTLRTRSRASG